MHASESPAAAATGIAPPLRRPLRRYCAALALAPAGANSSHEHFVRVVPTKFAFRNKYEVETFSYTSESASFATALAAWAST